MGIRDLGGNPLRTYTRWASGSWSWARDDVYVGRTRVAMVGSSGTWYYHTDHVASPRVVTTASGTVAKTYDFYPYGLPINATGMEALWFSGYELEHQNTATDFSDDLYFLHARWYHPYMMRFLSPDPLRGDP
ncbi:MAG: hypothetical protein ACP5PX_08095, partial [Candidatus Hadarchaeum sp.]